MKIKHLLTGCLLAGMVWAPARTWTSSDGEKTFEGDLKEFNDASGKVTVLTNGKQLAFNIDALSEDDKTFLTEWKAESEKPSSVEILAEQKVGKQLTDTVLSRLDGTRFKKASLEKAPEYYLLYFSASW